MEDVHELTKKFKMVGLADADITTDEMPVIGTQALATCVGILIYSEYYKKAIVAHATTEVYPIVLKIMNLIFENKIEDMPLKYLIIPGYYYNHYQVAEDLQKIFNDLKPLFVPMDFDEITSKMVIKSPGLPAYEFAFDSRFGTFVSDKVLFGVDYEDVHKELNTKRN